MLSSNLQPEEREFVLDSGASMHMISRKDLSKSEMDTLTKSRSPTIVITANGEVQTQEEATVYVKEVEIFLTMTVLDNSPAVLSLGKLCDENGYSYEWINGQKPHLIKDGIRIICNTENFVPIVVPGLSSSSSGSSWTSKTPLINDFWPTSGNFMKRRHVSPRIKLNSPREESFTVPLKYIDVSRTNHTNLDVKHEKRIDDSWNVDGSRELSGSCTGFTQLLYWKRNPLTDIHGPG